MAPRIHPFRGSVAIVRRAPPAIPESLDVKAEAERAGMRSLDEAKPFDRVAEELVGRWFDHAGAGFAVDVQVELWRRRARGLWFDSGSQGSGLPGDDPDALGSWTALRSLIASSPDDVHEKARAELELRRQEAGERFPASPLLLRTVLSYLLPDQEGWAREDVAELTGHPAWWRMRCARHLFSLFASVPDGASALKLAQLAVQRYWKPDEMLPTLVARLGEGALDALLHVADRSPNAEGRRPAAEALAQLEGEAVARALALRLEERYVSPVAVRYLTGRPELAVPILEELVAGDRKRPVAAGLLRQLTLRSAGNQTTVALPPALRRKVKAKPLPGFWNAAALPRLATPAGETLPDEATEALGQLLGASTPGKAASGLAEARAACDERSLRETTWAALEAWLRGGAEPKDKWVLHALAHVGGDEAVRRLVPLMDEWTAQGGSARAAWGADVLGEVGSDAAVVHLQALAERPKTTAGLRKAAQAALARIADARRVGVEDLFDRAVPTLGLDADARCWIEAGGRRLQLGMGPDLKPFVADEEGQRLKRLPTTDDRAQQAWKALKTEGEIVVKAQRKRLEDAMCSGRTWRADGFLAIARHPLMGLLVKRLVWAARDTDDRPVATFRVAEDGSLASVDDEVITLHPLMKVQLPHPCLLREELRGRWRQVLDDYQLVPPFEQLDRGVHRPSDDERGRHQLDRWKGVPISQNRIYALKLRGWKSSEYTGPWRYLSGEGQRRVELDVQNETAGLLSLTWGEDGLPLAFGELDPIAFSEVVRDVEYLRA